MEQCLLCTLQPYRIDSVIRIYLTTINCQHRISIRTLNYDLWFDAIDNNYTDNTEQYNAHNYTLTIWNNMYYVHYNLTVWTVLYVHTYLL